jgi:hypothetical protein
MTDENGRISVSFTPKEESKIITIRAKIAPDNKLIPGKKSEHFLFSYFECASRELTKLSGCEYFFRILIHYF